MKFNKIKLLTDIGVLLILLLLSIPAYLFLANYVKPPTVLDAWFLFLFSYVTIIIIVWTIEIIYTRYIGD